MNNGMKKYLVATLGILALLLTSQQSSRADTITVNTTSLQGNPAGPFVLGFVLVDASLSGDGNNTAVLSNFNFGGGSGGAVLTSGGGATVNLLSGITLTDSDTSGFNFVTAAFTPGTVLSFNLALTANPDSTLNPASGLAGDQFLFVILDSSGKRISTTDSVSDTFATATIGAGGATVQQFSVPASASVPEPATVLLLGSGLVFGILRKRR